MLLTCDQVFCMQVDKITKLSDNAYDYDCEKINLNLNHITCNIGIYVAHEKVKMYPSVNFNNSLARISKDILGWP
jgi:hypothetical protein